MPYEYTGNHGDFQLKNPELTSYLYFPLANENSVMSSIAPDLGGDSKISQNAFFLPPVSCENLHNDKSSRNFWCRINGGQLWSLTGRSGSQQAQLFTGEKEPTLLEAGLMHHKITRNSSLLGLQAEIKSFVPCTGEQAELIKVTIKNTGTSTKTLQLISAIPIYGRSADNIRDHRHVTALLHRIETRQFGVVVSPTMSFDERGHQKNENCYGVFGGNAAEYPVEYYPTVESLIGEGGNLENPGALYQKQAGVSAGYQENGYEALGGLGFQEHSVEPGESLCYIFALSYGKNKEAMEQEAKPFFQEAVFEKSWEETKAYWQQKVNITYQTADASFDQWMRWVSFQPMLRRIYGCSFLPHHDYGKGGRGWRDLWQDCLALLLMNPDGVRKMLIDNFQGVRMDGTNATIIGAGSGEFIADRNNITRVWMDHGVWPLLTTDLYIQQTGDIQILLEENTYFKDPQVCRGQERDSLWISEEGERQKDKAGNAYHGSLLEHLLIQHLTSFYDVGEHNHIRLRGADWNDALDMASERGESVAFTAMYAKNLERMAELLKELSKRGMQKVQLLKELEILLSSDSKCFDSVTQKQEVLGQYCKACIHQVEGKQTAYDISVLQKKLQKMADWTFHHIRETEWKEDGSGRGFYNGYYDNSGRPAEGIIDGQVRMMLTGQVFTLMSGVAKKDQIPKIVEAANAYLYDGSMGGYRLNTDFGEVKMDLGRMFGFAYGQKENGAVFSHMTTMFGNALYQRFASKEAYHAIWSLFAHCSDFEKSRIYPGIPEYIDAKGRGLYHYLTGAASWMLLTVVTQMFGVRGEMGDLIFAPQLLASQFDGKKEAGLEMLFAGRRIKVTYQNEKGLEPDTYQIKEIICNGISQHLTGGFCGIPREQLLKYPEDMVIEIAVVLDTDKQVSERK